MQAQSDLRIKLPEVAHRRWQGIAGLRVGGCNRQGPCIVRREIACGVAQVVGISQQPLDDGQHLGAWFGQPSQTLTCPDEQLDAQLVFQFANLATDPGLRRVQNLGHLGQVEALTNGFAHRAQLLKIHDASPHAINAF